MKCLFTIICLSLVLISCSNDDDVAIDASEANSFFVDGIEHKADKGFITQQEANGPNGEATIITRFFILGETIDIVDNEFEGQGFLLILAIRSLDLENPQEGSFSLNISQVDNTSEIGIAQFFENIDTQRDSAIPLTVINGTANILKSGTAENSFSVEILDGDVEQEGDHLFNGKFIGSFERLQLDN